MTALPSEFELHFNFEKNCLWVTFKAILYTLHLISHFIFFVEPNDLTTVLTTSIKPFAPAKAYLPIW